MTFCRDVAYHYVIIIYNLADKNKIEKEKKKHQYHLVYDISIYHNILYRNPGIVIRILSADSCQYKSVRLRTEEFSLGDLTMNMSLMLLHVTKSCVSMHSRKANYDT